MLWERKVGSEQVMSRGRLNAVGYVCNLRYITAKSGCSCHDGRQVDFYLQTGWCLKLVHQLQSTQVIDMGPLTHACKEAGAPT